MGRYGQLDAEYHKGRRTKKSLIYRLNRRAKEVISSVNAHLPGIPENIIELGAADGLLLSIVKNNFPRAKCLGIEYSYELVKANADKRITVLQGDVNFLPISDNCFDIAIATAIIEHLPEPKKMLAEARRILRPKGILILTSPDPFWERLATLVGHLKDKQHFNLMNLQKLASIFEEIGYDILEQKKFMLSPVGMPFEIPIENIIRSIGLNFLFANQLVVGKIIKQGSEYKIDDT